MPAVAALANTSAMAATARSRLACRVVTRALVLAVIVAAFATPPASAQRSTGTCTPPRGAAPTAETHELLVVTAARRRSQTATAALWTRTASSCWQRALGPYSARVGINGLAATRHEGDGTTPIGTFALGSTFYGTAPAPGVRFRYHRLVCGDWWDEDPTSPSYNRFRHLTCHSTPAFGGKSEQLWLGGRAYTLFAVIAYNTGPVVRGAGSAIFLHADKG